MGKRMLGGLLLVVCLLGLGDLPYGKILLQRRIQKLR